MELVKFNHMGMSGYHASFCLRLENGDLLAYAEFLRRTISACIAVIWIDSITGRPSINGLNISRAGKTGLYRQSRIGKISNFSLS